MNKIELAQDELLREAKKAGDRICKLIDASGFFVKVRRGYSYPDDLRELYNQAFEGLVESGKLKCALKNHVLELYEVVATSGALMNKRSARRILLQGAEQCGHIYKIHSADGEFVQAGTRTFWDLDEERILVLKALSELVHEGWLRLVHESRDLTSYESSQPRFPRLDDDDIAAVPEEMENLYSLRERESPTQVLPKTA